MDAPDVQHTGKENEGSPHRSPAYKRSAAPRAALQENIGTGYTRTDADRDASHPKPESPSAAALPDPPEGPGEAQTGGEDIHACHDEKCGPVDRAACIARGSTVDLSLGQVSAEMQKDPTPREQAKLVSFQDTPTIAQKVHPADMLDGKSTMEAGRCYTEILHLVKPKPDRSKRNGPLWRLPGPAFGPMQRGAAQGNAAKAKEAVSQVRHPTQGGTRVKAQASSRTLKLPPARTYTEMAERQIKAAGHKGALRQGVPSSGADTVRPPYALRLDKTASAVEQANTAAVTALDRSKRVPGVRARKLQVQVGKENSSGDAANSGNAPPARVKRPLSQPGIPTRKPQGAAKGREPQGGELRKPGAAAEKPRAPFRPGGNAPLRSARPSALANLDKNYTIAHKRMQEALQKESRAAEEKVRAAEWDVARKRNKQVKIERALEDQSLRTSQERRMTRILLSSEHTLQEIEQSGNIIAFRSISGQSMSSVHDIAAAHCSRAAPAPASGMAVPPGRAPAKGLHAVPEESPHLAQVYDMSILRAAQRHPRRQLLKEISQPMPEEEKRCQARELSQEWTGSRATMVLHASADTAFPGQSVGHNPFFGEALKAQVQDGTTLGDSFVKGDARSNPTFEPSDSSSLLQPSSQNTVQGPVRSRQRSMPCSAMELSCAVSGASLPGHPRSTTPAQGSRRGPQDGQKPLPATHQRGRVLPTSASLGRLTMPSSLRALPEPSSEPSVTGPCPDLPSCLHQLAELRNASMCGPQPSSSACTSGASGGQVPASQAATLPAHSPAVEEAGVQHQAASAMNSGAEQEACSSSDQQAAAHQPQKLGRLPFASRVQLHGQVLCEPLHDGESPISAHPEPWGGKEDRGVFSSTLSFLEKVRPSERFSPLENSLSSPQTLPGAALDYPLSDASPEQGDRISVGRGTQPTQLKPKPSLMRSVRAALVKCCRRLPCSSPQVSIASQAVKPTVPPK